MTQEQIKEQTKIKVIKLLDAYFDDTKTILVKDPQHGIGDWVSIKDPNYITYFEQFIKYIDYYKIVEL